MKITIPKINTLPYLGNKDGYLKNSFLIHTLYGIRRIFMAALGIKKPIEFQFTDSLKETLNVRDNIEYPRTFFKVISFTKDKHRLNSLAMSKSGVYAKSNVGEGVKKATVFPISLALEFHYMHTDAIELFQVAELVAMMTYTPIFSFRFNIDNTFECSATIDFVDTINVAQFDLQNGADVGSSELVIPFTVTSFVGFTSDQPWVHVVDQHDPITYDIEVGSIA